MKIKNIADLKSVFLQALENEDIEEGAGRASLNFFKEKNSCKSTVISAMKDKGYEEKDFVILIRMATITALSLTDDTLMANLIASHPETDYIIDTIVISVLGALIDEEIF